MSNVLLITTIYPLPIADNQGTPVCHFFTREWVKMGHHVQVVHIQAVYPAPFYWAAKLFRGQIAAKTGAVVYTKRDNGGIYEMDSVPIFRLPLFKPFPHGRFTKRGISLAIKRIVSWLDANNFEPSIIIGHFPNPQIEIVGLLKENYAKATTAIVMHGDVGLAKKVYGVRLLPLSRKIDIWGFRNKSVMDQFERTVMKVEKSFICYSGIPEAYITKKNTHEFTGSVIKFIYVGEMIERKYPVEIMDALKKAFPDGNYELTYVGEGRLLNIIRKRIEAEDLQNKVRVLGKIPRDSIMEEYDKADCMVMISRGEAYGLVYLEAMARGCITIASKGEGFDGIIKDGENGFLCKPGDSSELAQIMRFVSEMSKEEKLKISTNAIETSKSLTDFLAAKRYINDINKMIQDA